MIKPTKLKGFQDHMPEAENQRSLWLQKASRIAIQAGFQPIQTPCLEYASTLLGQGEETDKQVFLFEDHGGRQVGLRYDLTVPFARFVAENHADLVLPFKRLQVGPVWRGEKPQRGRYREFCQFDLDIIGTQHWSSDVEILTVIGQILGAFQIGPVTIKVGHRPLLMGLLRQLPPLADRTDLNPILIAIDKLMKIGAEGVEEKLVGLGISSEDTGKVLEVLGGDIAKQKGIHSELDAMIAEFSKTVDLVSDLVPETVRVEIDLSIVRGLDYYDGIVFETFLDHRRAVGSICSGGRYNRLTERFSKQSFSGVGVSIGIDRLLSAQDLTHIEMIQVLVIVVGEDAYPYGFQVLQTLRTAGIASDIAMHHRKVAQGIRYALRRHIPLAIVVGETEAQDKTFNIKNLDRNQENTGCAFADLVTQTGNMIQEGKK